MDAHERVWESKTAPSLLEWGLIAFLFYTLLSYPFYLKYFSYGAYQLGFTAFLLVVIVLFAIQPQVVAAARTVLHQPAIMLGVACYCLYVIALSVASLLHAGEGYLIGELGRVVTKGIVGAAFVACLTGRTQRWMLDRYADVMFIAAIAGIVLVLGVLLGWFSPVGTIQLPSAGVRDDGLRDVYRLGFGWGALPLPGGGKIMRLQSFTDEPGTFAFALLVALLWAAHKRRRYHVAGLAFALALTWSVGALIAGLGALAVYLWRRLSCLGLVVLSVGAILTVVVIDRSPSPWSEVADRYLQAKIGLSQGSSLGDRLSDIGVAAKAVERHPLGLGGGSLGRVVNVSLGVGWMRPLAEAGLVGFTGYLLALGTLSWLGLRSALSDRGEIAALGGIVVVLAFAAFQRARMDESIWHWWLMAAFVRTYVTTRVLGNVHRDHPVSPSDEIPRTVG